MLEAAVSARIVKAASSRQITRSEDDVFLDLYEADRAIRPAPLTLEELLTLAEEDEGSNDGRVGCDEGA